jgi:hypothetical protein
MPKRAILISNVKHVSHQIDALAELGFETDFFGLRLFSPHTIGRVAQIPIARPLAQVLEQRRGQWPKSATFHGLGPGTYTSAIVDRLRLGNQLKLKRLHLALQRAVLHAHMSKIRQASLVHFVEGLGLPIVERTVHKPPTLVMERRALHPAEMARPMRSFSGFPDVSQQSSGVSQMHEREFQAADAIIVYSELAKQSYVENGIREDRVWVVPIPFDAPQEIPPGNKMSDLPKKKFVFVGACQSHKGIDLAATAVTSLGGDTELVVAGFAAAPVRAWLHAQPKVRYVGILGRSEIETQFRGAAALVMPSKESLGLAILEGIRARVPCIISSESGIATNLAKYAPECIVYNRDPVDWARRLDWVSGLSASERDDLTSRSYKCLSEFSYSKSVSAQCSVYDQLLN